MAKLLKLRRGSTTAHASFTGAEGEVTIDTTKDTAVVHDGAQAGGRPLAREDMNNVSSASIAGRLGTDSIATTKIAGGALPTDVTVTNGNVVSNAAIAGTKINPSFGSQTISTSGNIVAANGTLQGGILDLGTADTSSGHINAKEAMTFNIDSDNDDTNRSFKWYKDGSTGSGSQLLALDESGTLTLGGQATLQGGVAVTGNISVSGTVDGRDVAADGSKLDGIDSGAKDDQTKAEIDALNINADQVDGLHASSFVRSDASDTLTGQYDFQNTGSYPIVIGNTSGAADAHLLLRGSANPYIRFRENNTDKAYIQWNSGGFLQLSNEEANEHVRIQSGNSGLRFLVDGSDYAVWHSGNDGSGSGLDADTLDGIDSGSFVRSDQQDSISGQLNINGGTGNGSNDATLHVTATNNNDWGVIIDKYNGSASEYGLMVDVGSGASYAIRVRGDNSEVFRVDGGGDVTCKDITASGTISGNGSGLTSVDANTLDGIDSSLFLRSNTADTAAGDITFTGGAGAATIAANSDISFSNGDWTGNHTKIQHHGNYLYMIGGSSGFVFREGNVNRWIVDGDGHFIPATDSTYNIGSNSTRVANGYFDTLYGDGSNLTGITSGLSTSGGTLTGTLNARSIIPTANNTYDLGSSSKRWANLYINDMHFANSPENPNQVDGTWGDWTLQEAEDTVYMLNNRNGKKFKMVMQEIIE